MLFGLPGPGAFAQPGSPTGPAGAGPAGGGNSGRAEARGELDAALRAYEQALEIAVEAGPPLPLAGLARLGIADVLYERNDLDAAVRHATEGAALCRQLANTQPLAAGLARLAWIRQATGDSEGALEAMAEAWQVASGPGMAGLFNPIPAQRARLLLACGDVAAAAQWARQRGVTTDGEPDYSREPEHLVLARVLLAQDRPDAALALAQRWLAPAVAAGRTASIIELHALQALALDGGGDQPGALRILARALVLAFPQGYVRVFADEGAPRDPDIVRAKALARAASTHAAARHRSQEEPAMVTPASKPGEFFPPELLRLLGTARWVIDEHVNRRGHCAACASRWPCRQAELAEFALAVL